MHTIPKIIHKVSFQDAKRPHRLSFIFAVILLLKTFVIRKALLLKFATLMVMNVTKLKSIEK